MLVVRCVSGFWKRTDTLFEQPMAKFTKSLICVGLAADGTRVIQYSTIERFNYMIGYDKVKQPTLTVKDTRAAISAFGQQRTARACFIISLDAFHVLAALLSVVVHRFESGFEA